MKVENIEKFAIDMDETIERLLDGTLDATEAKNLLIAQFVAYRDEHLTAESASLIKRIDDAIGATKVDSGRRVPFGGDV